MNISVQLSIILLSNSNIPFCYPSLIYMVAQFFMDSFYCSRDSQLIGAQVDQEVLKEMLSEKLPKLSAHFNSHGVDPTLFSLNWFLCIFVDTIPVKTYLHIWDAFLFEGTKVSFYFSQKY